MPAARIKDVAEHAGVSVSTVSNVLNGRSEKMRPLTFRRVEESIRALRFQPNQVARQLKTGTTPMLGLLVPSIASAFSSSLAREIEAVARQNAYYVLLGNTQAEPAEEERFLDEFMAQGLRGTILTSGLGRERNYLPLLERGLALISLDRKPAELSADSDGGALIDFVSIDNVHAGRTATEHLLANGHTAIVYATAPVFTSDRSDRRTGFLAAMKTAGREGESSVIEHSVSGTSSDADLAAVGRSIAEEIAGRAQRPTGVVAMSDMVAIGMVSAFQGHGIRVPQDISIVGIDDLYLDALLCPALTSVRQPLPEIAAALVTSLIRRLRDPKAPAIEQILKPDLIPRSSVASIAHK
ncbi:MAG TPA: LacI family DNA-binding transcriptional regulator [Polyangia bacterium]